MIYLNNLQKVTATVLLSCKGWKRDLINNIHLKKMNTIKLIYTWIIKNEDNTLLEWIIQIIIYMNTYNTATFFLSCKRWERDLNEWQFFITANKI